MINAGLFKKEIPKVLVELNKPPQKSTKNMPIPILYRYIVSRPMLLYGGLFTLI